MTSEQSNLRLGVDAGSEIDQFGPLSHLVGAWVGTGNGWNIIAVPDAGKTFNLEVAQYQETITFKRFGTNVPNKGGRGGFQKAQALAYELRVSAVSDGAPLHVEDGMWLFLQDSDKPIVRQAIVPHGDSILMTGTAVSVPGSPNIGDISSLPLDSNKEPIGSPYSDPYTDQSGNARKTFPDVLNPNKTLQDAIHGQKITNTITYDVNTDPDGGVVNIPFIKQNADVTSFSSTFWLETVVNDDGTSFQQLQYSQNALLFFDNVFWPHIDVNTLRKQ